MSSKIRDLLCAARFPSLKRENGQRGGMEVCDFLVEPALRHPNFPNLFQQVVEIFLGEYAAAILQAVAVYRQALNRIVLVKGSFRLST